MSLSALKCEYVNESNLQAAKNNQFASDSIIHLKNSRLQLAAICHITLHNFGVSNLIS